MCLCADKKCKHYSDSELLNEEVKKLENDRAEQMKDRIKPLPDSSGMDEEQLKQLCRELHAAIDKVNSVHSPHIPFIYSWRKYVVGNCDFASSKNQ